jgi:hypothetical protein
MLWALNALSNIGAKADPTVPLSLAPMAEPRTNFVDLTDVDGCFLRCLPVCLTDRSSRP